MDDQVRVCKVCNEVKPLSDFTYIKRIDKYTHTCKVCKNIRKKEIGSDKKYYEKHKEKLKARTKKYYRENKEIIKERVKEYTKRNQDKIKEYKAEHYKKNKEHYRELQKTYYEENAEQLKQYQKDYKLSDENREKIRKRQRAYKNYRLQTNELYKITEQLRNMIRWSFYRKGYAKKGKTKDIIGCDYDTFYSYLLKTFKDNYGYEWDGIEPVHIDHIIPLATATTEQEIYKLCYYTNLQLLKAQDNLDKSDKLDYDLKK